MPCLKYTVLSCGTILFSIKSKDQAFFHSSSLLEKLLHQSDTFGLSIAIIGILKLYMISALSSLGPDIDYRSFLLYFIFVSNAVDLASHPG